MLKIIMSFLIIMIAMQSTLHAQTIKNTVWKTYFDAPVNDTATLTIGTDSATIANSHGMTMVVSSVSMNNDTIKIVDVSGPIKCPSDYTGIYNLILSGDKLIFHLLSDDCDGRANSISNRAWMKVNK